MGPWNDFCFCVTVNIILMPTHLSLKVCSNDDDDHHGGGNHIVICNISCCAIVLACDLTSEQVMCDGATSSTNLPCRTILFSSLVCTKCTV